MLALELMRELRKIAAVIRTRGEERGDSNYGRTRRGEGGTISEENREKKVDPHGVASDECTNDE